MISPRMSDTSPASQQLNAAPAILELRGEIYMRHDEFERINRERAARGEPLYANPRNLAAGTIKLVDPAEARSRQLDIVLYGIGACEPAGFFSHQAAVQQQLQIWNCAVLEKYWLADGIEQVWDCIEELDALRQRFAYPTDGAVIKLNEFALQQAAGYTAKAPRWAIAYKFAAQRTETRLQAISLQIGRTGTVTPVAILEPVQLATPRWPVPPCTTRMKSGRKDIRRATRAWIQSR